MAVIADTGPLYALADRDDQYHAVVTKYITQLREVIVVPSPIIPEACYLLLKHLGPAAESRFLGSLIAKELLVEHFTTIDLQRAVEILEKYADAEFGMVDAAVMAIAERLNIRKVLTLDHRHFELYRPKHCARFELVPARLTK